MTDLISREAAIEAVAPWQFDTEEGKASRRAAQDNLRAIPAQAPAVKARPLEEWQEDMGDCVWWCWEEGAWLGEAAWIGSPIDSDWPNYHTHFTPHPDFPATIDPAQGAEA